MGCGITAFDVGGGYSRIWTSDFGRTRFTTETAESVVYYHGFYQAILLE